MSKHLFASSETQLQVFYSALDQRYHGDPEKNTGTTTDVLRSVQSEYYSVPYVDNTVSWIRSIRDEKNNLKSLIFQHISRHGNYGSRTWSDTVPSITRT